MKEKIKRLCRQAYLVCFYALSKVCFFAGKPYTHDQSMDILRAEGYPFKPLWSSTPPIAQ